MGQNVFFTIVVISCHFVRVSSLSSSCTINADLTTGSLDASCSLTSVTQATDVRVCILAPVSVSSSDLSYGCYDGSGTCAVPAFNVSASTVTQAPAMLSYYPRAKYFGVCPNGTVAVFEGSTSSDVTVTMNMDVFMGSFFTSAASVDVSITVKDLTSGSEESNLGTTTIALDSAQVVSIDFRESSNFLFVGEADYLRFDLTASNTGQVFGGSASLLLQVYSDYLLNVYEATIAGTEINVSEFSYTELSNSGSCMSDICLSDSSSFHVYQLDISSYCCSGDTTYDFEIRYHLLGPTGGRDSVFINFYIVADDVPKFVAGHDYQTYGSNPGVILHKTVQIVDDNLSPQIMQANLYLINQSPVRLYSVTVVEDIQDIRVIENSNQVAPNGWENSGTNLTAELGTLTDSTSQVNMSYDFSLFGNGENFPSGEQYRSSRVYFYLLTSRQAVDGYLGPRFEVTTDCPACFTTETETATSREEKYELLGLIILTFALGFLLMLLILFLMVTFTGYSAIITVSPISDEETPEDKARRLRKELRKKRREEREARRIKRGKAQPKPSMLKRVKLYFKGSGETYEAAVDRVKSAGVSAEDAYQTLPSISSMDDALKSDKMLVYGDIAQSIAEEARMEAVWAKMSEVLMTAQLESFQRNGLMQQNLVQRITKLLALNIQQVKRELSHAEVAEQKDLLSKLGKTHEKAIKSLRIRQIDERKGKSAILKGEHKAERHAILKNLDKQHKEELENLTHLLQLERDEEFERIRRKYAVDTRIKVKEVFYKIVDEDAEVKSQTSDGQREAFRRNFVANSALIEKAIDSSMASFRFNMDKKLALRRHYIEQNDLVREKQRMSLNLIAEQIKRFIETQTRLGRLTQSERGDWMLRMRDDLVAIKSAMENQREKRFASLHASALTHLHNVIDGIDAEEILKLKDFDASKTEEVKQGSISMENYVEERFKILEAFSQSRVDNEMGVDRDSAKDIREVMKSIFESVYIALEDTSKQYVKDLAVKGCDPEEADTLMQEFEGDKTRMEITIQDEIVKSDAAFQKDLAKKSKKWEERRSQEKSEMENLRQHEETLAKTLLERQWAMSESERERILEEKHRLVEEAGGGSTLHKLATHRLLQQKLHAYKEAKLRRLLEKQQTEIEAREQRKRYDAEELSDADFVKQLIIERVQKLTLPKNRIKEQMYQIEEQLVRQKLENLKNQEERIAALIISQQMQKARELAQIEEQHAKLVKLKMTLMTEFGQTESYGNTESATQRLVQSFEQRVTDVQSLMEEEKAKQVDALRHKIADRKKMKQDMSKSIEEQEVRNAREAGNLNPLELAALSAARTENSQLEEIGLDREKAQLLEGLSHDMQVQKLKALQDQEEEMVRWLVQAQKIDKNELVSVLMLLFPHRSGEELAEMAQRLAAPENLSQGTGKKLQADFDKDQAPIVPKSGNLETVFKLAAFSSLNQGTKD